MRRLGEIVERVLFVAVNWLGAAASGFGVLGIIIWLSGQEPPGGVDMFWFFALGGLIVWGLSVYWLWRGPARLVIRVLDVVGSPTPEDVAQIERVLQERREGRQ